MKLEPVIKKIALATALCFGASFLLSEVGGLNRDQSFPVSLVRGYEGKDLPNLTVNIDRAIPLGKTSSLTLRSVSTDITLLEGQGDQIKVNLVGDFPVEKAEQALIFEDHGSELLIRTEEKDKDHKWNVDSQKKSLTLIIPKSMFNDLKTLTVETVSGVSKLKFSSVQNVSAKSVSGDITLKGDVKELSIATVSGSVDTDGKALEVSANSISGDFNLKISNPKTNAKIHSVSGKVAITLPKKSQVEIEAHSTSGKRDFDALVQSKLQDRGFISVNTVSGDIRVQ